MAKFSSPLDAIVGLTESVTKDWTKQRKAEERNANARSRRFERLTRTRHITIKEAAFDIMKEAYQHASDDGRLPANPRQIYYAARRKILIATGRDTLESGYFLQTITSGCPHLTDPDQLARCRIISVYLLFAVARPIVWHWFITCRARRLPSANC